MKYTTIRKLDVSNGPGVRVTLFVSGCTHKCEGCFNEDLQDFNNGDDWTKDTEDMFIGYLKNPVVVGINLLGGEPLQQTMDDSLLNLLKRAKEECPDKDIWMWTGDVFEDILGNEKKMELLKYADVLVDGRFELSKRNIKLKYRGSENQRVLDVVKSIEKSRPVKLDNQ
ncbi:MAG: anaerobic ribonucleoside-triphosphate reductase activating protein [Peptostreptococcus sp.]|uniref:anaerobic ribonucleoside-triphosphate reductase activating protein n=1 Tax=Peptostreptococcus TaxID=1257 RepID=UPI002330BCDA|nr:MULTISPECIES: anaerobic ribonucleoside-triphosphate reductase activating protein [Peptostreptococcus]MDB8849786.1 anaerobic ribonucleoside-triphosphate reductase activating protein [Peptostreptococcus anaerobius]MDB8853492.1 anaerobic ribonucleoside-triphosphate reductase activating protein [Peptostreptococcus anaerobius]MDB8855346.1 anaerobic ribonucleoside-triphosphate reductase activating protein [Peptostreptococcus anaerobius]MDU1265144.1 anaerobic ribonucleoside-triphosphate reductase a